MNIGLFSETYYPEINGVATSVYTLKNELENRGHNVYVFTTTTPGAPEHEHNVFRVPSIPFIFITERRVGLFYQPKLAHIIKKLSLDIIHTHTEFSLGIFGRIMARELRLPIVHTYHTIYEDYTHYLTHFKALDRRAKAFARTYSKVCCNTVEQVIVPTEKTKDLLMTYSVHKDISVVPTGIDLSKFDPKHYSVEDVNALKQKYKINPQEKILLYIGRISQEKNIEEIISAMPEYMKTREMVKFVIVGSGPALERLENLVKQIGLEERFVFTGSQPWDTIGLFYQLGDVFVSASKSETQGLTYIEAMASGLPVVAREDKCLEDILDVGSNGYSFTDTENLHEGLDQILFLDKETNYSENALNKVKKYSTQEFAYQVEKVYQQVMSRDRVFCKRPAYDTKKI
jgi:1,2-diacylglycerol 3-alpha-glucosyltransferase